MKIFEHDLGGETFSVQFIPMMEIRNDEIIVLCSHRTYSKIRNVDICSEKEHSTNKERVKHESAHEEN